MAKFARICIATNFLLGIIQGKTNLGSIARNQ